MWVVETATYLYGPFKTIKDAIKWAEKEFTTIYQPKYIKLREPD